MVSQQLQGNTCENRLQERAHQWQFYYLITELLYARVVGISERNDRRAPSLDFLQC